MLTLWGWEADVERGLINNNEIELACGSQEKLESTVPVTENVALKTKTEIVRS